MIKNVTIRDQFHQVFIQTSTQVASEHKSAPIEKGNREDGRYT